MHQIQSETVSKRTVLGLTHRFDIAVQRVMLDIRPSCECCDADLPPDRIQVELTETAIIDDVERADRNLKILRASGVRVALDDFGTGYSSLVYLNQFAIDCIKIDKSFVDNVTRDRQSAVIVASVSRLAASLGMSVVAEGVETAEQRKILIAAGCGALQGYHVGKPMTARQALDRVNRERDDLSTEVD